MVEFLDLGKQYRSIKREIDEAIRRVVEDEQAFVGGPFVERFEQAFRNFLGARHCVGVGNGTDAIEIALEALELASGSEVVVPANSFVATSEAVTRAGHRVVFADVAPDTYTLTAETLEARLTPRTAAVIPVHLYGHPCDMSPILQVARDRGLAVIEDAAQAHGAHYRERCVGTFGELATFSFYPGKNLGAYGDAGAIVTDDDALEERCRRIANHGRIAKYDHIMEGRNSRLDGLQAAILEVKLRHLPGWIGRRRSVAERYRSLLSDLEEVVLPVEAPWAHHVYHLFVIRTPGRETVRQRLAEAGIRTGIHYPIALPALEAYRHLDAAGNTPVAVEMAGELLSLPMGEHLTDEEVQRVAEALRAAVMGPARV